MNKSTQHIKLLKAFWSGKSLTPITALRIAGTFKLSSRCGELRKMGYQIIGSWTQRNGKRFKTYRMPEFVK